MGRTVLAATAGWAEQFEAGLEVPEHMQRGRLALILSAVRGSRQATRIPGFERITTARDFQDAVPMRRPAELTHDIEEMARGVRDVLTREPVLRFERSG